MSTQPDSPRAARVLLKKNAKRTVERESQPGAPARAIKRYHGAGVDGWFDGLRARSEFRLLGELFARGLAVPRAIEVRRTAPVPAQRPRWELVTEWIDGAVPLDRVLRGEERWPASEVEVARALGRLLAEAHALGLDHPDLHPGNVLVGRAGRAWLLDLRRAHVRARISVHERLADLAHAAAGVRELSSARFRARFLAAYVDASPPGVLGPNADAVAHSVERAARLLRREHVLRARLRWTRTSSSCRALRTAGFDGIASRELSDSDLARWVERSARSSADALERLRFDGGHEALVLTICGRSAAALRASWLDAVRLSDHHLAAARPLAWNRRALAIGLALPPRAIEVPFGDGPEFAAYFRALHDRAIALRAPERARWFADERGRVFVADVRGIVADD